MPKRRIHRRVGRPSGAIYATVQATRSPLGDPLFEALGGWFGGDHGAACPDWLEPGCWNHRQEAHSISAGALLGTSATMVQRWAEACRKRAAQHRHLAADPRLTAAPSLWHSLVAMFWAALAGWLNGFLAGYISHLVLDARTPARIPII